MKKEFLFPNRFKKIGWILFVPSLILGIYFTIYGSDYEDVLTFQVFSLINGGLFATSEYFGFVNNCIIDEVLLICIIVGGLLVAFSRTKIEDELITKIRYESVVWATFFNFAIIIFATIFIFDTPYFNVMIANIFSMLLFYIIRFHFMLYKLQKSTKDEK